MSSTNKDKVSMSKIYKSLDNVVNENKKAIESIRYPNQFYVFEKLIGKGC